MTSSFFIRQEEEEEEEGSTSLVSREQKVKLVREMKKKKKRKKIVKPYRNSSFIKTVAKLICQLSPLSEMTSSRLACMPAKLTPLVMYLLSFNLIRYTQCLKYWCQSVF